MNINKLSTTSVGLAVTPTVISTLFSHFLKRRPRKERPTAHLSYDEGLHLIRSFLDFASHHTVEELQAFTAQWVPHPQWVRVDHDWISQSHLDKAAELLHKQLGPDGIRQIGGTEWWQWRKNRAPMGAEWIEMKSHANQRKRTGDKGKRVMMYIHGGAYFFGSVDEHRYQMQRHARKLKARVFAPKYRLAPQYPFPCGLQDCLAAYLYLLTIQDPTHIILAGDSAGGGMVMSLLCIIRDMGVPLPAGAILISPWVDLTHSFPSVGDHAPLDYIPQYGFHHKPSRSWPPPNEDDQKMLHREAQKKKQGARDVGTIELEGKQQDPVAPTTDNHMGDVYESNGLFSDTKEFLSVIIDGENVRIKDQIQMYTTNKLLAHPLVSPIMQPTLGGLPPVLIMVGGGEILRDEQVYLAHKLANPAAYAPPTEKLDNKGMAMIEKYKPTDVVLQVWDDLCHVAPTLSFTRPAKYMYRSVAQFGAWALARAQQRGIDIMDDDDISVISSSGEEARADKDEKEEFSENCWPTEVGKAGDPLPPFKNHMIRQRVTRHGVILPLAEECDLPGCCISNYDVGIIKEGQVKKWLTAKQQWDSRYATTKAKVHKKIIKDMVVGYHVIPGETPPPTALAGRQRVDEKTELKTKRRAKSIGLAMWSLWGSKHDEATVERERKAEMADQQPETITVPPKDGEGAQPFSEVGSEKPLSLLLAEDDNRTRSRRKIVTDQNQTGGHIKMSSAVVELIILRKEKEEDSKQSGNVSPETGAAGKRPHVGGIAMPFSLNKHAKTASMETLDSTEDSAGNQEDTPLSKLITQRKEKEKEAGPLRPETGTAGKRPHVGGVALPFSLNREAETASMMTLESGTSPTPNERSTYKFDTAESAAEEEKSSRPHLETFVTAAEDLPKARAQANEKGEWV